MSRMVKIIRFIRRLFIHHRVTRRNYAKAGLCHRCENRAKFIEGIARPRYECGDLESNKSGCYCYIPIQPVALIKSDVSDPRPVTLGMLSCRVHRIEIPETVAMTLTAEQIDEGFIVYWKPILSKTDNTK